MRLQIIPNTYKQEFFNIIVSKKNNKGKRLIAESSSV